MKDTTPTAVPKAAKSLPTFDGFPYLVTRVVPTLYHVILLPGDLGLEQAREIASRQVSANRLDTCLVLAFDAAIYVAANGTEAWSGAPPSGGVVVDGKLKACQEFPMTAELRARDARLTAFVGARPRRGFMLGDLTKGGRPATETDRVRLEGLQPNGIPRGLTQCEACGEWQGACLDPSPQFAGQVMAVYCRCANNNRCASCWKPLADRRLNANYFEEADGQVWHVPGFLSFSHRCAQ